MRTLAKENTVTIAARAAELAWRGLLQAAPAATPAARYRGYGEILTRLAELAGTVAGERRLGWTAEREPIFALELGEPTAKRITFVIAGLHALEWIGVEVALSLIERLAARPPTDRRVLVVPVVNVDGFLRVEESLRSGQRRYVRANARGVDLNRNWPTNYQRRHLVSRLLPRLGHAGTGPRSEPEVNSLCAAIESERAADNTIDLALSLHSFSRMLLLPYGGRFRAPAAAADLHRLARRVQEDIPAPVRYRVKQVARWYPGFFAHGMEIDHFHDAWDALALLVECSLGGFRLRRPRTWLEPFCWYNPDDPRPECEALGPALERYCRGADRDRRDYGASDDPGSPRPSTIERIRPVMPPVGYCSR